MIERYQTEAMGAVWSDEARFQAWTDVEVAACEAWHARGEVPEAEMVTIRNKAQAPTPQRVKEIEATTNHDVVAFVRALGEIVGEPQSRHLHRGLTSSDVVDTALAIMLTKSLAVVLAATQELKIEIGKRAREHKDTPCIGRTHGVHAEPTTFGLRLAGWYAELDRHIGRLGQAKQEAAHAKLSGAVGSFSQTDPGFEAFVLDKLDLIPEPIATQVVPRDRHAAVMSALALLGAGLERFALEIRSLQRTELREAEEPFRAGQTGSSAMPHKRNPITCERITGLARLQRGYLLAAVENVALWHDRDISHSSVERVYFPDAFHLAHYTLGKLTRVIAGLRVYPEAMARNMDATRGLAFSQNVLAALLAKGLDRHVAYKAVQAAAMRVWEDKAPTFKEALAEEPLVERTLTQAELDQAFDLRSYLQHVDALFARAGIP